MKVIGFANKFYTLWEVTEDTHNLGNGHSYIITHYYFIKNISFDKETAIAKYPEAKIDENLRGKTASWDSQKEVWDNVDIFRFGKYKYNKINECADTNYIEWYWNNVYGDHKEYVGNVLESRGYEVREYSYESYDGYTVTNQYLASPETIENERIHNKNVNDFMNHLTSNPELEFVPTNNLSNEGYYRDDFVLYHFPEFKEMYYRGFNYYVPSINGKGKRFKNKNVKILTYTYEIKNYDVVIHVDKFSIK